MRSEVQEEPFSLFLTLNPTKLVVTYQWQFSDLQNGTNKRTYLIEPPRE